MRTTDLFTLAGKSVSLLPLDHSMVDGLVAASADGGELYQWSLVPQGKAAVIQYVETALAWREAGTAVPFAICSNADGRIIGSTRYWNIERWLWPAGHARHNHELPDTCEIGYTWLTRAAIQTGANTEAKRLMLTHAFEAWQMWRVCFHTDARNVRSRAALARIGGKFEGILRAHRMAADYTARDSARFSILAAEWPEVKDRLLQRSLRG